MSINKGFDPSVINDFKSKLEVSGKSYLVVNEEDNSDEYIHFNFLGVFEGKEVIYDCVIYTLRLHHNSELYELAEHKAAQAFPEFKKIMYQEDENGDLKQLDDLEEEIGLFMAETMMELEDEATVKVKEHIEIDANIDFGVGLDVGLNLESINENTIEKFIHDFNEDNVHLDDTLYSFEMQGEELA